MKVETLDRANYLRENIRDTYKILSGIVDLICASTSVWTPLHDKMRDNSFRVESASVSLFAASIEQITEKAKRLERELFELKD